ncbi:WD40 repeat-like protein [Metschnikowia bicuspidata var. bicuspidata NRRL YB-4993]|uniref:Eukaryotic translation initiation factor 3 subunit I n=1 Tax=Metschnikowia bicuspidata var. bicuspidata NRRL YB-4993 TaxID=869754 RepID=A0A1A0HIN7_9ASCO|nr:WD40 repeat-like protein [Metschnikowia bicuspidata var. bicuspidata NRRL YB-4993]OBA23703.1 WD40 repeat-like protein [Metschnikowia bicuspidata var. bicuspidata NRRL YB-4993]
MRPIKLMGHQRSLTQVKFNREGDIIFSVAKDSLALIWYSSNGERLGTLEGHQGTIWSIDVDLKTELCATGSADLSIRLWNVQTGENVFTWDAASPVRRVAFSPDNLQLLAVNDKVMGSKGAISVYDINYGNVHDQQVEPRLVIETRPDATKVTVAGWAAEGKYIIAGHEDGFVSKYDAATGEFLQTVQAHGIHTEEKVVSVTDIQFAQDDNLYFITSSKDKTAVILDVDTLEILKVYKADAPMNTAAITPRKNFVILGGGQEARNVTTTLESQGKFEARFYHKIFTDEIGRVKGHFGPLNTVAVHPDDMGYVSGGEDGFIRVHYYDKSYFDFEFDAERTERVLAQAQANATPQAAN